MSAVHSYNDFDPLEEIIVGSARDYHIPFVDLSLRHFFEPPDEHVNERIPPAELARVIDETEEDLQAFADTLTGCGVTVRRPMPFAQGRPVTLLDWSASAGHALMPRDCLLVIGDRIIEVPMPVRARYVECFPYRGLLREYFESGATWLAAPRPQLPDETYQYAPDGPVLAEDEPLFDAANVIRCGRDLFFNVSNTGNRLGAAWLRRILGPEFAVHEISICADHVGTTVQLLKPGVLLANAGRLRQDDIPAQLRSWKILWFDDPIDDGYALSWPRASVWIGMNIVSVDQETIIVPGAQESLVRLLEKEGFTTIPVPYRHGRTFGGGFHCCSADIRRRGSLESYC